jgi:type II secretory pathway pseudopilin PulG
MKFNQKGFSVVEILILIVIVGLLGAVGWLVFDRQKHKNDEQAKTQTTEQTKNESLEQETAKGSKKTFDCKGIFSLKYSDPLQASMTTSNPPQCLISNVKTEAMPGVGPLPPEQLGLFFNVTETTQNTSKEYLNGYMQPSEQGYELTLKGQEEIKMDNGKTATLATVYGGHPGPHDFYFFIYIKNGKAIMTDFPVNSNHKDLALSVLKSIQ